MSATVESSSPVPHDRLKTYAQGACNSAFKAASDYDHSAVETWNHTIINSFLKDLVTSTTSDVGSSPSKRYKYAVTSTIIQHLDSPSTSDSGTSTADGESIKSEGNAAINGASQKPSNGRRGMHSATGAYWNNDTDGIWTYKWEGAEEKGCDVVLSVIWVLT